MCILQSWRRKRTICKKLTIDSEENKLVGDLKNRNLELEDENVALKARIQSMEGDACRPPKSQRE